MMPRTDPNLYSSPLKLLFVIPYIILLISGLTLPSDGSHGLFSIKSLAFIGSVASLSSYIVINNKLSRMQYKLLFFLLVCVCFLLFWALISGMDDAYALHSMFDQFKIFSLTVGMIGLSLFVVNEGLLSFASFVKIILTFNLAFSTFKIGLIALFLLGFIKIDDFLNLLGIQYMAMNIIGNLSRLQTSMDIATPYLLLFLFQSKQLDINISRKFKYFYIVMSFLSIVFSFSRFLFFIFFCSIILYWLTLPIRKMLPRIGFSLLVALMGLTWVGWDKVYKVVENRFFSDAVEGSDLVRVQQIDAMMREFYEQPYLGKGLGGYAPDVIRNDTNPYSYEVQWVSFLMQFGLVGMALLMVPIFIVVGEYLTNPLSRVKISFLMLFFLWLLSGFTNPFLISLASGMMYSLFALTAYHLTALSRNELAIKSNN